MQFKEYFYNLVAKTGVGVLSRLFPEYFAREPLAPTDRYIEYAFVIKNLPKPPIRILDIGCSGSFFPLLLASFGYETYGIDIRNYPILNKLDFENFKFTKSNSIDTQFPAEFFDTIVAISTLEHIGIGGRYAIVEDLGGDLKTMSEIWRILKPDGNVLLTVPYGKNTIIRPYMRLYYKERIREISRNFIIKKEEYYMQDKDNDWIKCKEDDATQAKIKPDRYPLCLLCLGKQNIVSR
jgi:ubiquinone/menaquinone biosynthesis C-methylase UbiE